MKMSRSRRLVKLACDRGVDLVWFRSALAFLAWTERGLVDQEIRCGACEHTAHPGDLCGAPLTEDGEGICVCARQREADTSPQECPHSNMTASVCACGQACPCKPCPLPPACPHQIDSSRKTCACDVGCVCQPCRLPRCLIGE